jgi:quercetin dioxygenase-like cupin family protein
MDTHMHSTAATPVLRGPHIGPRHDVLGAAHLYKLLPAESANALAVIEATIAPGVGAPPHRHADEDEAFYVIGGTIVATLGDNTPQRLEAGSFFLAPRGVSHSFHNERPVPAKLLVIASPGTGLVHMFGAIDEAGQRAGGMPAIEEVVGICADHGVTILPPT